MPASLKHLLDAGKMTSSILAKWPADQRYYAVDIVDCDKKSKKCKIKYEDGYQCWVETTELHLQLATDDLEEDQIVCCVCDDGHSKAPNEIVICDVCNQGYHVKCHQPAIDRDEDNLDDADAEWVCSTCKYLLAQDNTEPAAVKVKKEKTTASGRVGTRRKSAPASNQSPNKSPATPAKKVKKERTKSAVKKAPRSSKKAPANSQAKVKLNSKFKKDKETIIITPAQSQDSNFMSKDHEVAAETEVVAAEPVAAIINNLDDSHDTVVNEDGTVESIERMDSVYIMATRALSAKEGNIETEDFLGLISPGQEVTGRVSTKTTTKFHRNRKTTAKAAANTATPAPAAAY